MDTQKLAYPCEVKDVYSGDDLILMVDLGVEGLWKRQRVRLHGVDTPNAVNVGEDTEAGKVRKQVRDIVRNRRGVFQVVARNSKSWVGVLIVESPAGVLNINEHLQGQGYVFNGVVK